MNHAAKVALLKEQFDKRFPVSTDLQTCLVSVHNSYELFRIHKGHTEKDGHLEEGFFAVHPVIQHCVKDIWAAGKSGSGQTTSIDSSCAAKPAGISGSIQTANSLK